MVVEELKRFTGFDRVMFYQFGEGGSGTVLAEAREDHLPPYFGLNYPATDIPDNARNLYKKNLLRLVADVDAKPVRMIPAGLPYDLSEASLRAVSPFHIRYLQNMGVKASMSISVVQGGELAGLIACHHYQGSYPLSSVKRICCLYFGLVVSGQLQALQQSFITGELLRRQERAAIEIRELSRGRAILPILMKRAKHIMACFEADGMVFIDGDKDFSSGSTPSVEQCRFLMGRAAKTVSSPIQYSINIAADFGEAPDNGKSAGVMMLTFVEDSTLFFFRDEKVTSVRWAGRDEDKLAGDLTPRHSFEEWVETVRGTCETWSYVDLALANDFHSSLASFVLQQALMLDRLSKRLKATTAEVQQFAYTVSHDLKAPLVSVNGWIGAMEEDIEDGEFSNLPHAITRVRASVTRMNNLIEELLAYSRIGRVNTPAEEVSVDALVREIVTEMTPLLEEKSIAVQIEGQLPNIDGHPGEISRVFENLIGNAIKYGSGHEKPQIRIFAEPTRFGARFCVSDNGEGIDPQFQHRIFELFQRLDTKNEGSGVGLASVVKVAQLHDGKAWVESDIGAGASFWIELKNQRFEEHESK